jgi:uncharacterized membrane protein YcaP (DUF421 family)
MTAAAPIDWRSMLVPTINPLEIFIRGSVVFLFIFGAMRIFRRQAGTIGISDLLVVVLIADAAQNAMASDYKSISDGLVLIITILFWNYVLDWLPFRFPRFRPLLEPAPIPLIRNGKLQAMEMRDQMLTEGEMMEQLREHGIETPDQVKLCYLDGDGHISVIPKRPGDRQDQPADRSGA